MFAVKVQIWQHWFITQSRCAGVLSMLLSAGVKLISQPVNTQAYVRVLLKFLHQLYCQKNKDVCGFYFGFDLHCVSLRILKEFFCFDFIPLSLLWRSNLQTPHSHYVPFNLNQTHNLMWSWWSCLNIAKAIKVSKGT